MDVDSDLKVLIAPQIVNEFFEGETCWHLRSYIVEAITIQKLNLFKVKKLYL